MPAGGLEIVHQEVAENRVGALGGKLFLADLAGQYAPPSTRPGMILAAVMTRVLFFPGLWPCKVRLW